MTFVPLHLPVWAMLPAMAIAFAAGLVAGRFYFADLWRTAQAFSNGGSVIGILLSAMLRLAVLGAVLVAIALSGALPLLSFAVGVTVARHLALRAARKASQ